MLVTDLLIDLKSKFPRSPIEAWERTYRDALTRYEGDALRAAYAITMQGWGDPGPPKPAHIAANMPEGERPKSHIDVLAEQDIKRMARIRERADTLLATARRECAAFFGHDWSGAAAMHLTNVCRRIAYLEEEGASVGAALARINGNEPRPGYPPRPPDVWLDEHDGDIFRARWESWQHVNPKAFGLKRGDREPPWRKNELEPPRALGRLNDAREKTRERLTAMHIEQDSA